MCGLASSPHQKHKMTLSLHPYRGFFLFPGLNDDELPHFILVCNFERFHLYNLTEGTDIEFALDELPSRVELFGFMIGFAWEKTGDY